MSLDRVDMQSAESRLSNTNLTAASRDAYSSDYSFIFKSDNGAGVLTRGSTTTLDFAAHDIYNDQQPGLADSQGKGQETHDDARPTPLAIQQRLDRLAENRDVDQAGAASEKSTRRKMEAPDKSQETSEGAITTPLAARQRLDRLAQNKDVDQGPARMSEAPDKSQETHDGAKPTARAVQQREERLMVNQDVQQS